MTARLGVNFYLLNGYLFCDTSFGIVGKRAATGMLPKFRSGFSML